MNHDPHQKMSNVVLHFPHISSENSGQIRKCTEIKKLMANADADLNVAYSKQIRLKSLNFL